MDADGKVLKNTKFPNTRDDVNGFIDNELAGYDCSAICESTARLWIKTYEEFERRGIPIILVNPARLGLPKFGAKTDKKDSAKLANKLRMNDTKNATCYVHGPDTRRVIDMLRHRIILAQERTRYLNRQHAICDKYDYAIKTGCSTSGEKHQSYLNGLKLRPGDMVIMDQCVSSVRHINSQMAQLERMISKEASQSADAKLIMSMTGFDAFGALLVAASIDDITRFSDPKKLVSFLGLCPRVYQSGNDIRHGRMKKDADGSLTYVMMNAALVAKQHDRHLAAVYERHIKRHPPTVARSHVANKMAVYIHRMLSKGERYWYVNKRLYETKLARLKAS